MLREIEFAGSREMSDVTFVITIRGLFVLFLAIGAIVALILGYRLYKHGAGLGRDNVVFKYKGCEIKAGTVGSVLMITAWIWVGVGAWVCPTLNMSDGTTIVSHNVPLDVAPIVTYPTASVASVMSDPEMLRLHVRESIEAYTSNPNNVVALCGEPARYDPNSVEIRWSSDGWHRAEACLKSEYREFSSLKLSFNVSSHDDKIVLRPWACTRVFSPNRDPNGTRTLDPNVESGSSMSESFPPPGNDRNSNEAKPAH